MQIWQKKQVWLDNYETNFGSDIFLKSTIRPNNDKGKQHRECIPMVKYGRMSYSDAIRTQNVNSNYQRRTSKYGRNEKNNIPNNSSFNMSNPNRNKEKRINNRNFMHRNGTTYIGSNIRSAFLGSRQFLKDDGGGKNERSPKKTNLRDLEETTEKQRI